jgi:hypothetical protein
MTPQPSITLQHSTNNMYTSTPPPRQIPAEEKSISHLLDPTSHNVHPTSPKPRYGEYTAANSIADPQQNAGTWRDESDNTNQRPFACGDEECKTRGVAFVLPGHLRRHVNVVHVKRG